MNEETQDFVYALAVSPDFERDGVCFAARQSGLLRSTDGGHTWQTAYASLQLSTPLPTTALVFSPGFTLDRTVFAAVSGGVLRSSDGGESWQAALFPTPPPNISALAISPDFARDAALFAATLDDGVFCSTDRGASWVSWNFGLVDRRVLCLVISPEFSSDRTLFVGTESGIFESSNGGRAWNEVNLPTDLAPVLSLALPLDYPASHRILAGTESAGLFDSTDNGKQWTRLGAQSIAESVNAILLAPDFPHNPGIMVLSGNALFVSRDNGRSWAPRNLDTPEGDELVSVLALRGFCEGQPLLTGFLNGKVLPV